MPTRDVSRLPHASATGDGPSLGSLKTAEQVAQLVRLPAERILELSRAQVLPHFRIDGGEPLFYPPMLKAYVREHLTLECPGAPLPLDLRPVVAMPVSREVPMALTLVCDRLREWPGLDQVPCVYFLVEDEMVRYVGQSRNLAARLAQHSDHGRRWDRVLFLPVPESELLRVEREWIRTLQPPWNRAGVTKTEQTE
ncbi:MAG: GIY-YIG nuclease family protein [Nitrospira sp.]|nr:GIY-YIG nuclease family protein [Nitrospira sp.]